MDNFIYDETKNRYYRILPSQATYNPKFTTTAVSNKFRVLEGTNTSDPRPIAQKIARSLHPRKLRAPSTDIIETFDDSLNLVTASRFGCLCTPTYKSPLGRSITCLHYSDRYYASAVDEHGSVIASEFHQNYEILKDEFVQKLTTNETNLVFTSSNKGLRMWDLESPSKLVVKTGLHTHTHLTPNTLLLGSRAGDITCFDLRSAKPLQNGPQYSLGKGAVTNILPIDDNLYAATGLDDQMALFDLRGSTEILRYSYSNNSILRHGAGVLSKGVLAVAQDTNDIKLYDGITGATLREFSGLKSITTCIKQGLFSTNNRIYSLSNKPQRENTSENLNVNHQDHKISLLHENLNVDTNSIP